MLIRFPLSKIKILINQHTKKDSLGSWLSFLELLKVYMLKEGI
nr:MAG TPA: hypothetical protein [Caudoviricetes sp.]